MLATDRCDAASRALAVSPEAEAAALDSLWSYPYARATATSEEYQPIGFRAFGITGEPVPAGDADRTAAIDLFACGETTRHDLIDAENIWLLMRE